MKYTDLQKEYSNNQSSLLRQIASIQEAYKTVSNRLREIEMENDDMERHERYEPFLNYFFFVFLHVYYVVGPC
jgi:hypothetical protein